MLPSRISHLLRLTRLSPSFPRVEVSPVLDLTKRLRIRRVDRLEYRGFIVPPERAVAGSTRTRTREKAMRRERALSLSLIMNFGDGLSLQGGEVFEESKPGMVGGGGLGVGVMRKRQQDGALPPEEAIIRRHRCVS